VKRFVCLLLAAAVAAVLASAALAHSGIEATYPKRGATLATPPAKVTITFEEEIRSGTVTVKGPSGAVVSKSSGGRDAANVARLRVALKSGLGSGQYTVKWSIKAADGDAQSGSFKFTVR
jgi:methionine-rich copper-binding protein CopC